MNKRNVDAAWEYHRDTKHSVAGLMANTHYLDFSNQPLPFKIYTSLEPIALPRELALPPMPALSAISASGIEPRGDSAPDLPTLGRILYFSAGITKRQSRPGGETYFRAASCTGALYHIELYVVCGDLAGVEAGVYHFGPADLGLRVLRKGDYRACLVRASGGEESVSEAPAIVVCTSTYWRNAWKYQARTYRHCFWDNGTILANLLGACAAQDVPARVVGGFVDGPVNELLGLDTDREAALTLVSLGRMGAAKTPPAGDLEPLVLETAPLSRTEVDYPAIRRMHAASALTSEDEAASWRGRPPEIGLPPPAGPVFALRPHADAETAKDPMDEVIRRRGSTRQFARVPITFEQLSTMLDRATRGIPADYLGLPPATMNHLYVMVNAVDDLPAGAYVYHRGEKVLEQLREGDFRDVAGHLGLDQEIPADASMCVFFLTDLNAVLGRFGNRGYRAAQLEAAIMGGKLYLAAYAQRLGASGLTFYDDEVTDFFSPHGQGKSVMFLMALGKSVKRRRGLATL